MRANALALAFLCAAACGKGGGSSDQSKPDPNAPAGSGAKDAVVDAWKKGGLTVSAFTPTQSKIGSDCTAGTVGKLEVVVCNFPTADAAKQAETAGLEWVGDTTGSSQAKGTLVIAVADRHKADPNGKTINQIFKLVP
jgi:hypothetical protein